MSFHYDGKEPSSNGLWAQVREEDIGVETRRWGLTRNFHGFKGETCGEHWTRSMDAVNSDKGVVDGRITSLIDDTR